MKFTFKLFLFQSLLIALASAQFVRFSVFEADNMQCLGNSGITWYISNQQCVVNPFLNGEMDIGHLINCPNPNTTAVVISEFSDTECLSQPPLSNTFLGTNCTSDPERSDEFLITEDCDSLANPIEGIDQQVASFIYNDPLCGEDNLQQVVFAQTDFCILDMMANQSFMYTCSGDQPLISLFTDTNCIQPALQDFELPQDCSSGFVYQCVGDGAMTLIPSLLVLILGIFFSTF